MRNVVSWPLNARLSGVTHVFKEGDLFFGGAFAFRYIANGPTDMEQTFLGSLKSLWSLFIRVVLRLNVIVRIVVKGRKQIRNEVDGQVVDSSGVIVRDACHTNRVWVRQRSQV